MPNAARGAARWWVGLLLGLLGLPATVGAQASTPLPAGHLAPKPLYRDPVYDGAADPVVIWNKKARKWWMFYTNRRATDTAATGVTWVHGTRIGIAESGDGGATWTYRDTANISYRPQPGYTFWAPDVVETNGVTVGSRPAPLSRRGGAGGGVIRQNDTTIQSII